MELFLYALSALVLLVLLVAAIRLAANSFSAGLLFVIIVTAGLVYDNGVIAVGGLVGPGALLEALNWPRYVIHALATPLLVMVGFYYARRAGLAWARTRAWHAAAWLVTIALVAYGLLAEMPAALELEVDAGVVSYGPAGGSSAPIAAVATILTLIAAGFALGVGRGWWWLFAASLLATGGFALGPALSFEVLGQIAEVVLIGGLLLTERWLQRRAGAAAQSGEGRAEMAS